MKDLNYLNDIQISIINNLREIVYSGFRTKFLNGAFRNIIT